MPRCSIIIPVHNRASLTRQCLNTLSEQAFACGEVEIVVVNDGSTDHTSSLLASYGDRIRVITHPVNLGFARSCNDAVAVAATDLLVFLNNDTIPMPGWLDALVHYADDHPRAAVVGSKMLFLNDTIQHAGVVIGQDSWARHIYAGFPADHPAVNKSRRFQIVTAGCALMRRGPFEHVGGFDTAFLNGAEDVDLCLRLGELDHEIHYCHESVLYHLESVTREDRSWEHRHNGRLYFNRWGHRVRPDDLGYYLEDGLLQIQYWEFYPIGLTVSPLLGLFDDPARDQTADHLLMVRSRQVFDLLRENVRLAVRVSELELQLENGEIAPSAIGGR